MTDNKFAGNSSVRGGDYSATLPQAILPRVGVQSTDTRVRDKRKPASFALKEELTAKTTLNDSHVIAGSGSKDGAYGVKSPELVDRIARHDYAEGLSSQ